MAAVSGQIVTLELRRWIVEQTQSGLPRPSLLEAMVASGWQRATAAGALVDVLGAEPPPPAVQGMPQPALADAANTVPAGDREVRIVSALKDPQIVVFANLLDEAECDELVALAKARLTRSETVELDTGGSEVNEARTSEGMFFHRGETALVARIEARIAALLQWPVENGEGLQILRYRTGAEYRPHYDYFDPAQAGSATILKRGGQRLASLVMYLNTPTRGGATTFPDIGLDVMPMRGHAVFFSYPRPHPDTRTLHGGAPVQEGEKWVATKWLRQGRFD